MLEAADAAGMAWDDIADSSEGEVYARLFPGRGEHQSVFAQPDWDQVHREMARVGVTLKLLHGEYADSRAAAGEPVMGYDRFCRTYQRHVLVTGVASRVGHKAVHADAITDRIVHNTIWVDTGNHNMREHATMTQ